MRSSEKRAGLGAFTSCLSQSLTERAIRCQPDNPFGQRLIVTRRYDKAGTTLFDDLGHASHSRGDDRKACGHCLDQ